jgi:hypothetical protein
VSPKELGRLADALIEQYHRPLVGSLLVRIERHRKTRDIITGVRPLSGHPAEALANFRAPSSWIGIGLVCGGWAAPMDGIRPSAHPDGQRVTSVVLLDRAGNVEGRMRLPDGSVLREPPGEGLVFDTLLDALGPGQAA